MYSKNRAKAASVRDRIVAQVNRRVPRRLRAEAMAYMESERDNLVQLASLTSNVEFTDTVKRGLKQWLKARKYATPTIRDANPTSNAPSVAEIQANVLG